MARGESEDTDTLLRLAVLLSGTGRTLEYLIAAGQAGTLPGRIVQVVSSRRNVRGNEIALHAGLPLEIIRRRDYPDDQRFSDAVFAILDPLDLDLVLLAGYLCKLAIPERYEGRIMNIHPSLLPSFGGQGLYGGRVHQAVLDAGVKVSGCTVHFVDNDYDAGPIILQRCVPVLETDTADSLAARVFAEEQQLYPEAVRLFWQRRLRVDGRRVRILPTGS